MYCIVLNCQTPSRAKGRSSCRIPAVITNQGEEAQRLSEERRRLWLAAINRGELTESALKHGRVCGSHFVSGKAAPPWNRASVDWVPTLNLRHQTKNVDEERTQERAWRRFAKRRRKEARHDHIEAQKTEEKSSSGVQRGGNTTVRSTSKRARVSNSLQGDGEDSYAADDHGGEGDSTPPMMGVLGFSKKTTLALLNRMFAEELLSELERRNIEVKLAGGDRPRGRDDLEHVLREVMTREYEEVEGGNVNMDMSNTSSTSQHGCSNTSSSLEHEAGSSEVLSRPHDDQATTHDVQEPSVKATDMDVSETSSTTSVQVKKEPVEDDFEYCVATSSLSSDSVASTTEPSTSQTQNPSGIKGGSQRRSPRRAQKLAVRIKTEPSVEEETEDEQQDLRSEHCPTSPGQLSQELDQVEVSTEEEDTKPSSAEPVKMGQYALKSASTCNHYTPLGLEEDV
ncbi:Hypp3082 [Branchiostoma lanceolatum]|uniref:Hypp3082 protein n=1 Tax=Branchiostoma lanceolatum TaxID=7740 RepID=A0A8J9ZWF0_BRALA|nr:Hypp3082 [Branchiostoma lanceolatum]